MSFQVAAACSGPHALPGAVFGKQMPAVLFFSQWGAPRIIKATARWQPRNDPVCGPKSPLKCVLHVLTDDDSAGAGLLAAGERPRTGVFLGAGLLALLLREQGTEGLGTGEFPREAVGSAGRDTQYHHVGKGVAGPSPGRLGGGRLAACG